MKIFALNEFQDEIFRIQEALNGKKVQILFTTYKVVSDYQTGKVDTGKDDLEIYVENGNMPYNPMITLGLSIGVRHPIDPLAQVIAKQAGAWMYQDGEEAQSKVSAQALHVLNESKENLIIVAYIGIRGFKPALKFIERVKEEHAFVQIVVVTCNCQTPGDFMSRTNCIDSLVMTQECGGRRAMKTILEGFCKAW